jgi:hypothetical protein
MGNNVSASSKPIQGSPVPPTLINTTEISEEKNENKPKRVLENPGTMEELHKKCKGMSPMQNHSISKAINT